MNEQQYDFGFGFFSGGAGAEGATLLPLLLTIVIVVIVVARLFVKPRSQAMDEVRREPPPPQTAAHRTFADHGARIAAALRTGRPAFDAAEFAAQAAALFPALLRHDSQALAGRLTEAGARQWETAAQLPYQEIIVEQCFLHKYELAAPTERLTLYLRAALQTDTALREHRAYLLLFVAQGDAWLLHELRPVTPRTPVDNRGVVSGTAHQAPMG